MRWLLSCWSPLLTQTLKDASLGILPKIWKKESEVTQSCLTLSDPMDCSLPGFSVHGLFQAIVLEWIAISFSRGSSQPRVRTRVSHTVDRHFTVWATREATRAVTELLQSHDQTWMGEELLLKDKQRKWLLEIKSQSTPGEDCWNDNKEFRLVYQLSWPSSGRV